MPGLDAPLPTSHPHCGLEATTVLTQGDLSVLVLLRAELPAPCRGGKEMLNKEALSGSHLPATVGRTDTGRHRGTGHMCTLQTLALSSATYLFHFSHWFTLDK